jgi:hypothetical protein
MKRSRLFLLLSLWLLAAFLLAFPLRDAVEQLILQPLAYFLWLLNMLYRAIPQPILWVLVVAVMIYAAASLFLKNFTPSFSRPRKRAPVYGPVEETVQMLNRDSRGVYFKWQMARTLSEIALDLQELHTHSPSRTLDFDNRPASPEVRRYLDAGLNTSFSDYPLNGPFQMRPETPFDININPVLDYLESQMEMDDDRKRQ